MKILILGGGQIGSVTAKDLVQSGYNITVADINQLSLPRINTIVADLSDHKTRRNLMSEFDLIVGALPAKLGFGSIRSAIDVKKNYVDLSYCAENVLELDNYAKQNNVCIIPDCGVAPGLSNFIAGMALRTREYFKINIYAGGFAKDPSVPLGYAVSWSVEDVADEFIRSARFLCNGVIKAVKPMDKVEIISIPGIGELDALYTDGLRTLLDYQEEKTKFYRMNLAEKTVRRSGHFKEMGSLIKSGKFKEYIEKNCVGHDDIFVMRIEAGKDIVDLIVENKNGISAMAQATAFTCSAFTQLLAEGRVKRKGVIPPEAISENIDSYKYILDKLVEKGIEFNIRYPFIRSK